MKKKDINLNPAPKLKKKNGVWVKILVPALCLIAGAGAMAGLVYGVPAVGNLLIQENIGGTISPGQTSELQQQIKKLTADLNNANKLATERLITINTISTELQDVKTEKENLTAELETVRNNAELSEAEKQKRINELTGQIETLTNNETTLQNQLSTAVADKEAAESVVAGLQTQIAELQSKIDKLEGNAIVDTLKLENFNGTWYKNGTFEDYFTIDNQQIRRGAGIDSGVVYKLDSQVYFGLRTLNNPACALSENGTKITLEDGTIYTKAFINTLEDTAVNMGIITGEYSYGNELITLNSDNTLSYTDGTATYYGAYTATATKKNVGGNITLTHNIVATINKETQETMEFELINNNGQLITLDNKVFSKINNIKQTDENTLSLILNNTNSHIMVFRLNQPLVIENNKNAVLNFKLGFSTGNLSSSYYAYNFAGYNLGLSSSSGIKEQAVYLYNRTGVNKEVYYVEFGVGSLQYAKQFLSADCDNLQLVKIYENESYTGEYKEINFSNNLKTYLSLKETHYKSCNTITDYYTGEFITTDYALNLTSDTATITPNAGEPITATEYTVAAKTDGTNIIHTVKIAYSDTEGISHLITFDIVNNDTTVQNGSVDGNPTDVLKVQ